MSWRAKTVPLRDPSRQVLIAFALLVALTVLPWLPRAGAAETSDLPPHVTGSLPMQVWRLENLGASSINWSVVVHPTTGFVYVANQNGLLEFDGVRWQLVTLPRGGPVRSVAVAPDGRVWMGGSGQICRLDADSLGVLRAVDMGVKLPELHLQPDAVEPVTETVQDDGADIPASDTRLIGNSPLAIAGTDGVYFVLPRRIVRFRAGGEFDVWPKPKESNVPAWWSDGALHLVLGSDGIFRADASGHLTLVGRGGPRVLAAGPHPAGGAIWLAVTGPIHVTNRPRRALASPEVAELFRQDRPRCAVPLPDGGGAYGTINHGLVVLDGAGKIGQVLNRARGLPANRVNGVAVDREGGLWLAMHAGLVRVQLGTPLALHGLAQGLSGSPWDVRRLGERIYVTHSEGVAWRDEEGRFHAFAGVAAAMHQLAVGGGEALAAGLGLYSLQPDGNATALTPNNYRYGVVLSPPGNDRLLLYGPVDVQFWQRQAGPVGWKLAGTFANLPTGAEDLLDDGRGFLWLASRDGRLRRVDVRQGATTDSPVFTFAAEQGIPVANRADKMRFLAMGDDLLVTTRRGIWRYDRAANRFVPETRLAAIGAEGPEATTGSPAGAWLYYAEPTPRLQRVELPADGSWRVSEQPVPSLDGVYVHALHADEKTRTLWMAAQGQLLSYNMDWRPGEEPPPLRAALRRVQTLTGETLWHEAPFGGAGATASATLQLNPRQRAVRVEFTTVAYQTDLRGRPPLRFRTRASRIDADWSPWTNEPYRDLTNLPDGRLTFELQARDVLGRESAISRLDFTVLPPWWRTSSARVAWVLLGIGAVTGVIAVRTRALRRRSFELEAIVAARTEELRLQNLELERLHLLELDETAAAKLAAQQARLAEEKAHLELLRYQLNPHFLLNAFTTLRSLVFSQPAAAGEMVGRLAAFCRLALTRSDEAGATVAEEAYLVETYLATEQARWRDSLRTTITVDPAVKDRRLPPFLLQPLVENAVKYGGRTSPDLLEVRVEIADDVGSPGTELEFAL